MTDDFDDAEVFDVNDDDTNVVDEDVDDDNTVDDDVDVNNDGIDNYDVKARFMQTILSLTPISSRIILSRFLRASSSGSVSRSFRKSRQPSLFLSPPVSYRRHRHRGRRHCRRQ